MTTDFTTTDSPRKDSSPQKYRQLHSTNFATYELAQASRHQSSIYELGNGKTSTSSRLRIRRRANGTFDLVVYGLIAASHPSTPTAD